MFRIILGYIKPPSCDLNITLCVIAYISGNLLMALQPIDRTVSILLEPAKEVIKASVFHHQYDNMLYFR
jgi:hypothetical protein